MEKVSKGVEYILRCAIAKGGSVGYNPYMYRLGCADNIPPSDNFNTELQKYGRIDWGGSSFLGEGNDGWDVPGVWHAFYINDKGRSAIKTIDLERNGKDIKRYCDVCGMHSLYFLRMLCYVWG